MLATEAVAQLSPRLSLRGRLYLFSGAILILFAINVGTSLWGSFARNESSIAYREAVTAAQLTAELEQNLQNKRQQVLVLATLRETTVYVLFSKPRLSVCSSFTKHLTLELKRAKFCLSLFDSFQWPPFGPIRAL